MRIEFALCLILQVGLLFLATYFGFWMGRKTQDKPVSEPKKFNPGGQPISQYDAYEEAMMRKEE